MENKDDLKKERQREASRRWRASHPDQAKKVERDAYHRRQQREGKQSNERGPLLTLEEKRERAREKLKRWRKKNPEKAQRMEAAKYQRHAPRIREKSLEWYRANKAKVAERLRIYHLKKLYGLTLEQFEALGKTCHICDTAKNQSRYRLHVDHDHDTGKVRGLLCHLCNTGLGGFRSDPLLMMKAIAYLSKDVKDVS